MDLTVIAAALSLLSCVAAAISIGGAAGKAAESIARQPEASGKIMSTTVLVCALAEGAAIFGFVTALIILLSR